MKEESFQRVFETLRKKKEKRKKEKREKRKKKKRKYLFGCIGFFRVCELSVVF
ncbi:hypothetical protein ACMBCN_00270 [Candidatus Liberibacter asiaticus]|nr:hypothetical protein [Candidatus Liberibacter asiaticus]